MTKSYFTHTSISRLVSKKFIAFLILVLVCTILLVVGKLTAEVFANIIQLIAPIYLGADVVQNSFISHTEKKHAEKIHKLSLKDIQIREKEFNVEPIITPVKTKKSTTESMPEIKSTMAHVDNNGVTIKQPEDTFAKLDLEVSTDSEEFDPSKHRMRLFPTS